MICPVCHSSSTVDVENYTCSTCGSLEGVPLTATRRPASRLFGYNWASGTVAPWRTNDGLVAYKTPLVVAMAAFKEVDLDPNNTFVVDFGCGDASILVEAQKRYGFKGIGIEIDPEAIKEAEKNVRDNQAEGMIQIESMDFTKIMLPTWVDLSKRKLGCDHVIFTMYLLPEALKGLKPSLLKLLRERKIDQIIMFKWDIGDDTKEELTDTDSINPGIERLKQQEASTGLCYSIYRLLQS